MKKIYTLIVGSVLCINYCLAQTGNNQIGIGAEINPLTNSSYSALYKLGFGGNVKGLYGVGATGQITLTAGYSAFASKPGPYSDQTLSIIPFLAGYRYNVPGGFYAEAQAGAGILTTKFTGYPSFSQTNFAAALNVGYTYKGFDGSVRFYTEGDVISMLAIRIGYNFSLK